MKPKASFLLKYLSPALLVIVTTLVLVQIAITSLQEENEMKLSALSAIVEQKIRTHDEIQSYIRAQDTAALNQSLQPFLDEIVLEGSELGASVYLPEMEELVAIAPKQMINPEQSMHSPIMPEQKKSYESRQPSYHLIYSPWRGKELYNYASPVEIDGKVLAMINVNQTADSIAKQIRTIWLSGLTVCLTAVFLWLLLTWNRYRRDQRLRQEQDELVQWLKNTVGGAATQLDPNLTLLKDLPAEFARAIDLVQFERRQQLRILKELPLGIMQFDADGRLCYINPSFAEMIGHSLEELKQWDTETWRTRYRLLDGDFVSDMLTRDEMVENVLGFLTHRDGDEIPFSLSLRVMNNEDGDRLGYLMMLDDLTNEYALDRLHQKTHYVFNSVPLCVIFLDDKQRVTYVNPAVSQLFGTSETELLGKKVVDALPWQSPTEPPNLPHHVQQVLDTGARSQLDNAKRTIHNREYTLEFDLFPILNPYTSDVEGCMVLIKDKTLYQEWEELSQRVDAHSNYVQMAATIAHEVRNPMTSVRGFLQLLASQLEGEQHRSYLDVMKTEIDRMNAILSEYLSLARAPQPSLEEFNLSDLVRETCLLLEGEANYRGVRMESQIQKDCHSLGLSRELKQVLINLVRNAFDAMENRADSYVRIDLKQEAHYHRLTITDNGCGISQEQIQRIFEPFFTTKAMGTGLGLPVCKKIVESHGGRLLVTSTLGEGTVFTIELPHL